ncbi:MAG: signal protein PDZ [Chloroflexi bacterium HGW-Chloroflexi-6]|nr:MAG: signal protein PDZ [Chloroflexi bacterium HGW-Chloroflexi-6]
MTISMEELSNNFAGATEKAALSTVLVNARRRMPASGIAFAADLVLTANHIVESDDNLQVILPDGSSVVASLAGRDPGSDLAVLKLEKALATPAETSTQARVGQLALALGRPSTSGIEASLGVISAISGPTRTSLGLLDRFFRIDATPYPGFSGGPLVDAVGRVLGINTSGFGPGMFISIPADIAWKTADELARHGSIKRGYLGVRSQAVELPAAAQQALQRQQASGLLLVGIDVDTPAGRSELMVGDILVGVAGHPIADHDALFVALSGDVVGRSTPVDVLRGGQPISIAVTIEARPAERRHGHGHGHQR